MRIAIEGPPGVGKTTLCGDISTLTGIAMVDEPVDANPYLEDYYNAPSRWALAMQIDLLYQRAENAGRQVEDDLLFDRSLWGDMIFAETVHRLGLMEAREYGTYGRVFRALVSEARMPDTFVYLRASLDAVWARVQARNRAAEGAMTREYLGAVLDGYERFVAEPPKGMRLVVVDWSHFRPAREVWAEVETELER